jgi:hypothetical protein
MVHVRSSIVVARIDHRNDGQQVIRFQPRARDKITVNAA